MLAEKIENPPSTPAQHRATFFRQSGWLMIANIAGGALMFAVHFLAKKTGASEYGLFGTLLSVVMLVPAVPLQMVLAQQTAKALATGHERELSGIIRMIWGGLFGLWVVGTVMVILLQGTILRLWGVSNPAGLLVLVPVVLISLWMPLFCGILQGQQNFFWLGWSMMANAIGRFAVAALAVLALGAGAVGMIGIGTAMVIAAWHSRALWQLAPLPFDRVIVLRQVVPLLLGFVFVQFLFTGDTMFVKHYFSEAETGSYVSAGTLSRALIWLVGPLASVMFPRIVHSATKAEKTDLMSMVLVGTAILAVTGAAGLAVLGQWVIKLVFKPDFVPVATEVLPWYAAGMVPLALANVLVNDLLARSQFKVVPFIFVLGVAYGGALVVVNHLCHSLVAVLRTLGTFNLLLLAVCAWFSWGTKVRRPQPGN